MKKTIAALLTAVLLLPACSFNVNIPSTHNISDRMEASTVLLHMKVHAEVKNKETGKEEVRSGWGSCSGVYIKDNVILTAAHCIDMPEGISLVQIWIKKGDKTEKAVVIKYDAAADLAILYTPLEGTPIRFANKVVRGEDCWVVGNPIGIQDVLTKGIVSKVGFGITGEKAVFTVVDAVTLPGNSGGAVVDSDGRLIGILTRGTSMFGFLGASGLGLAVDLDTIHDFLD